jgi:hypothetical protein
MRVSKLKIVISQLIFAGCVSASMSSSALAGGFYYPGQYSNAFFQGNFSQYRFRPLKENTAGNQQLPRRQENPQVFNRFASRAYMPQQGFHPVYIQPQGDRYDRYSYRPVQPVTGYNAFARSMPVPSYEMPAFARQYAWHAAQPRGFRRGAAAHHYANQSSGTIEQSDMSEYRSSPVTSQGFRYRAPTRNSNFVSFTDRVNPSKPVNHIKPVQPEFRMTAAVPSAVMPEVAHQNKKVLTPGELLSRSGNFRFRPDERFQALVREPARVSPVAVPVSYKLANAAMPESSDASWNNWSFRPADSAF